MSIDKVSSSAGFDNLSLETDKEEDQNEELANKILTDLNESSGFQDLPKQAYEVPGSTTDKGTQPESIPDQQVADASRSFSAWTGLKTITTGLAGTALGKKTQAAAEAVQAGIQKASGSDSIREKTELLSKIQEASSLTSIQDRQVAFRAALEGLSASKSDSSSKVLDIAAGVLARGSNDQITERLGLLKNLKSSFKDSNPEAISKLAETLSQDRDLVSDIISSTAASGGEKLTQEHLDSMTDFIYDNLSQLSSADRDKLLMGSSDLVKNLGSETKADLSKLSSEAKKIFDGLSDEGKKVFANNLVDFASKEAKLLGINNFDIDSAAGIVTQLFDKDGKPNQNAIDNLANDISNRVLYNPQTKAERSKAEEANQAVYSGASQAYNSIISDPYNSPYRYGRDEHGNRIANYSGLEAIGIGLGMGHDRVWQDTYQAAAAKKDPELRSRVSSELNQSLANISKENSDAIKFAREIIDHTDLKPKTDIRLDDMLALKSTQADLSTMQRTSAAQSLIAAEESHPSLSGWQYYSAGTRTDSSGNQLERIYALKGSQATLFERAQGSQDDWTSLGSQNQAGAIAEINKLAGITSLSSNEAGETTFYTEAKSGSSPEFEAIWKDPEERKNILETYNMGTIKTSDGQTLVTALRKDGRGTAQVLDSNRQWQELDSDLTTKLAQIEAQNDIAREASRRAETSVYQQQQYYNQTNSTRTSRRSTSGIGSAAKRRSLRNKNY